MDAFDRIARPGNKVSLQPAEKRGNADAKRFVKTYNTRVSDVKENGQLELYMPMDQTRLVLMQVGAEYDLLSYITGGIYSCRIRVAERYKVDSLYMVLVDVISPVVKKQRREYYRFNCTIPMKDRLLSAEEEKLMETGRPILVDDAAEEQTSIIVDISGGGLRFVSAGKYELGDRIRCRVYLQREMILLGEILGSKPRENAIDRYEQRIQFVNITRGEREEIVRYIFEQERISRKNGKED